MPGELIAWGSTPREEFVGAYFRLGGIEMVESLWVNRFLTAKSAEQCLCRCTQVRF